MRKPPPSFRPIEPASPDSLASHSVRRVSELWCRGMSSIGWSGPKAGEARVLIIEDVDRLGRDQEHLSYMRKLFTAYDVALHTVAAGQIDDLTFAFKGIIGEQQRMRIAYTTRRGLRGKAARGGSTGGKTLGYATEIVGHDPEGRPLDRLKICPDEAELVLCIFGLYADGHSLKAICGILDDEGVPSPRARERGKYNSGKWNPSTLSGNVSRGEASSITRPTSAAGYSIGGNGSNFRMKIVASRGGRASTRRASGPSKMIPSFGLSTMSYGTVSKSVKGRRAPLATRNSRSPAIRLPVPSAPNIY